MASSFFAIIPPHRQGFALGLFGSAAGFGLAAGPSLAGFILDHISWLWVFYLNIPPRNICIFNVIPTRPS
jgi:DHA2 family lincomycin resistance protein-like MFS transporter